MRKYFPLFSLCLLVGCAGANGRAVTPEAEPPKSIEVSVPSAEDTAKVQQDFKASASELYRVYLQKAKASVCAP